MASHKDTETIATHRTLECFVVLDPVRHEDTYEQDAYADHDEHQQLHEELHYSNDTSTEVPSILNRTIRRRRNGG